MFADQNSPLILIVEDSSVAVDQLKHRIETEFNFEVLTAGTYAESKEIMAKRGKEIFLSVLDLHLPDAQEGEVVDLALEFGVPCIVFTSTVSQKTRQDVLSKQVVDYVVKSRHALDEVAFTIDRLSKNCGTKVLVVDDSRSIRMYLRALLELYMFQVVEAESGERALEILDDGKDIRLVITDYEMEGMNGVELTSTIRSHFSRDEMAIIGISTRTDKALSVQFIKQGANDYLDKPFEKEEFFCRVLKNVEAVEDRAKLKELDELKNRFLGMVVHDLRNPINAIKGFAELLLGDKDGCLTNDHKEMTGIMHRAAIQMNDLVSDILDITVIESGHLELQFDESQVDEVVRERVAMLRIPAERKCIELAVDIQPLVAVVDQDRLAQVVDNLLSNAVKFSPPGTKVSIRLKEKDSDLALTVSDQGQGIPEEEQGLLFNSFQRLSIRPTAGESSTGLGLAIVKKIVESHKGTISVSSTPGSGSSFTVFLPLGR